MQRMLGLENDHPGFGERALSTFLRSLCCNAPVLLWEWEAGDMYMSHCTGCRELIGSPNGSDMDRIRRLNELPVADDIYPLGESPSKPFIIISGI